MRRVIVIVLAMSLSTCSSPRTEDPPAETSSTAAGTSTQQFPEVVSAEVHVEDAGTYGFEVTISSPYDSPERYADAWRILSPDGTQLGIRELLHHHADEQPFTRTLSGVEIPADVSVVTIQARDLVSGWGGTTVEVTLP